MKIAVCDDTLAELNQTSSMLKEFVNTNYISCIIEEFNDPQILLNKIKSFKERYDLYVLDVVMNINGINLAGEIINNDADAKFIFTTTSREFALDAYNVHAFDYIIKPLNKERLFSSIAKIFDKKIFENNTCVIKTDDLEVMQININNVAYLESSNRRIVFHMLDKSIINTTSIRNKFIDSIPFDIEANNFIICHNSYIINMNQAKSITDVSFIMKNDEIVPISKRIKTEVKRKYIKYLLGE